MTTRGAVALTALVLTAVYALGVLYVVNTPVHARRTFSAVQGGQEYRVSADEIRIEGFCTVFLADGERFAAVCGQHTVTEMVAE